MRYLNVRGSAVRVHETGDPEHPPILLLHGIGRSLEDWLPQHDRLSERWRVISVDLPGFGLSERLPEPISLATLASGVRETLDVLGERRPLHVMGNSLGGAVSMQLLVSAPERVATLTLVNSAGFGKEVAFFLRALAIPGLGKPLMRRMDARVARRVERALFADRVHATQERVDFALRVAARPDYAAVFLETAQSMGGLRGIHGPWRQTLLSEVAKHPRPTLIVWGDRDLILPAAHLAAARTAFPDARSHLYPNTGHMPQIERPDEFAELAELFLTARSDSRT
ncbi:alpha/beta fold hydrolase [Actinoplanes sp. NPDC051859]|uniref:alpha/beta fold hydrolase n=1 Tax=Actinoplanes sp. NPDC051859 TaxID=3363909 RepID=UPI00378C6860